MLFKKSHGHLFILNHVLGTIGPEAGGVVQPNQAFFYKITKDNLDEPTIVRASITNSNGLAWNKANNKLYYIDTPTLKVVEFDFDAEAGNISGKKNIFHIAV